MQPERVYRVHLAQNDLAAAGWTQDSPEPKPTPPPPLRTATQTRLRASLAVRAVSTMAPGAATASSHPAPLEASDLECEDQEDHDNRDNDIINNPPSPDYDKILFDPDDCNAFVDKAAHHDALSLLKTALQSKERDAKREYEAGKAVDPKDPEVGAELFSNMPGKARRMPYGLHEFRIDLIPGALPVRQGMR